MTNGIPDGTAVIREILEASRPRPGVGDSVGDKNQYAVRFADQMAKRIAADLGARLRGIEATTKRSAASAQRARLELDVNFSTPQHGLALGISLKSVHLRDAEEWPVYPQYEAQRRGIARRGKWLPQATTLRRDDRRPGLAVR